METSQRHKYEVWASNLLYLAFATCVGFEVYLRRGFFAESGGFLTGLEGLGYGLLAVLISCFLSLSYFIRQGKAAAKYLYLVLFAWDISDTLDAAILPDLTSSFGVMNFVTRQVLTNGATILILLSLLHLRITNSRVLLAAVVALTVVGFLLGGFYIHIALEHASHPPENFEY